jgi:hypothetical protein
MYRQLVLGCIGGSGGGKVLQAIDVLYSTETSLAYAVLLLQTHVLWNRSVYLTYDWMLYS